MKIRALHPQRSRQLALSLLLAALALVFALVAAPVYLLHRHYDQDIERQLDLLARYSRIGATAPSLAAQLDALKAREARSFFLKSAVPALAASEIQEILKGIAESNGGKISSMQIPEHKDDGNFRKVTVNIQMSATMSASQKVFYLLETRHPYLMLDNISIRSTQWQAQRGAPPQDPELIVQFDATGYAVKELIE